MTSSKDTASKSRPRVQTSTGFPQDSNIRVKEANLFRQMGKINYPMSPDPNELLFDDNSDVEEDI